MTRRRATSLQSPALSLTTMLDVVFNILAFFVATYSPPSPERNFDVSLPPQKSGAALEDPKPKELPEDLDLNPLSELTITITATADGDVASIVLENKAIPGGFDALARELRALVASLTMDGGPKMEAANIVATPGLKYRHLVAAIDSCYQAGIVKINFGEAR